MHLRLPFAQHSACTIVCVFLCLCVSVRGWKSYDMWQLVGWCQWGRMEQRRKRLLPWQRWAGVADGRVAWSSCQLRQRELQRNNANDSLLLLWLWTMALRNIHVLSQMTATDHYAALALISPFQSTRFLHLQSFNADVPQQVKFKTVCVPLLAKRFDLEQKRMQL